MKSYCVLAPDSIEGNISQFPGKTYNLGLVCSKLKVTHPVDHFSGFLGKYIKIYGHTHYIIFIYISGKDYETTLQWYVLKVHRMKGSHFTNHVYGDG